MRVMVERGPAIVGRLLAFAAAISCGAALAEPEVRYLLKQRLPPKDDSSQVEILQSPSRRAQVRIGKLRIIGDPGNSRDVLVHAARTKAAEMGADFVRVTSEGETTRRSGPPSGVGYRGVHPRGTSNLNLAPVLEADMGVFPKATLGVEYMASPLIRRQQVIKGFRRSSKAGAAGVEIGDEIIEIDGISTADEQEYVRWILASEPGQFATLRLKRGDSTLVVKVPLVSND